MAFKTQHDYYDEFKRANARGGHPSATNVLLQATKAALEGDARAAQALALIYLSGDQDARYVPRDPDHALKWFRKAAELGDPEAQMSLGQMYETGKGLPLNTSEARRWYELARKQGTPGAQEGLRRLDKQAETPTGSSQPADIPSTLDARDIEIHATPGTHMSALPVANILYPTNAPTVWNTAFFVARRADGQEIACSGIFHIRADERDALQSGAIFCMPDRRTILDMFILQLTAAGCQRTGKGQFWYSARFRPPA